MAVIVNAQVSGGVAPLVYTVSTLPIAPAGTRAFVTDALLPSVLGIVTGGGAVYVPVYNNGTSWIVG